jgi:hypothetical protein
MKQSGMRLKSQGACLLIFASAFAAASSSFPACLGQSPTTTTAPATSPSPVPASPATGTGGGRLTDLPPPPIRHNAWRAACEARGDENRQTGGGSGLIAGQRVRRRLVRPSFRAIGTGNCSRR